MAKFTFHNPGGSSYFTLEAIPRKTDGLYPTSSTQINFISGSGFSDVTSSVINPFVENDFKWSVVLPPGTSSFVWPSGSTENATTVPASESQMASTGDGTVTIGETTFNLQDLTSFTFAPELVPGSGGGGGGLATVSNAFSMTFNGVDEFLNIGNSVSFDHDTSFTISCWVEVDEVAGYKQIYSKYDSSIGRGITLYLYTNSGSGINILYFDLFSTNAGSTASRKRITTNAGAIIDHDVQYHVAVTYDGSGLGNGIKVYRNGIAQTVTITQDNLQSGDITNSVDAHIGATNTPSNFFNGEIDEYALFTASLDASTVESIYSASLPLGSNVTADLSTLSTPPVAWYRMGD